MKKLKNIIIILIILILILGITLVILSYRKQITNSDIPYANIPQNTIVELAKNSIKEENDNIYFTINDLIQNSIEEENTKFYIK